MRTASGYSHMSGSDPGGHVRTTAGYSRTGRTQGAMCEQPPVIRTLSRWPLWWVLFRIQVFEKNRKIKINTTTTTTSNTTTVPSPPCRRHRHAAAVAAAAAGHRRRRGCRELQHVVVLAVNTCGPLWCRGLLRSGSAHRPQSLSWNFQSRTHGHEGDTSNHPGSTSQSQSYGNCQRHQARAKGLRSPWFSSPATRDHLRPHPHKS